MKSAALIPARFDSKRFPGKMLAMIGEMPLIVLTWKNISQMDIFDDVIVVTDNEAIFLEVEAAGGKALMSEKEHRSGTDRIAEAAEKLDHELFVNVQGDEPFISKSALESIKSAFSDESVQIASLMRKIDKKEDVENPNIVKVVTDDDNFSMYFSRSTIPYNRDGRENVDYYGHIGVYAFRREILLKFPDMPQSELEKTEKLEQLRFLSRGYKIKMIETEYSGIGIDTPKDLEFAREYYEKK